MKSLVIARLTFREAARKKVLLGAIVLTLGFIGLFALGSYFAFRDLNSPGFNPAIRTFAIGQILMSGLYVSNFLGGLLGVFIAVGTISSEIDQGTLHSIVPKPLGRWEVVIGKWLGFALMLLLYMLIISSLVVVVVFLLGDYVPPRPVESILILSLETIVLLSLSIFGSTILATVTNGIVMLTLYGIAIVAGMVQQIGALINNATMINIGNITNFVIPTDVLWRLASFWLQGEVSGVSAALRSGPFSVFSPPSPWMVVYAVAYIVIVLGAALLIFSRRDL